MLGERSRRLSMEGLPHCWGGRCHWSSGVLFYFVKISEVGGGAYLGLSYLINSDIAVLYSDQIR